MPVQVITESSGCSYKDLWMLFQITNLATDISSTVNDLYPDVLIFSQAE